LFGAVAAAVAVALIAFLMAWAAGDDTGFNPDESRWLSRAHYLADLAEPLGPTWADRYMTRGQPPLGSYMTGLGLLLQGRDLATNPPWDFSQTWEVNVAIGNKPVPADLAAGRHTSAALVALTALALIAAARTVVPAAWAVVAGALYALHPFTSYIGSLAVSDALFGFLIALAALAARAFARRPSWVRAAILGIVLGLGGATKLSPLVVAAGLAAAASLALLWHCLRRRSRSHRDVLWAGRGLAIGVAAVVAFVAIYPYLWFDPIGRTSNLFAFRAEEMAAQAADWPVMAVPTRSEALRRVGVNFSERFSLADAATRVLAGQPAPLLAREIEMLFPLAGILLMAAAAARDGPASPRALVFAVLGGQVLVTVLGMRSEFDRYHVPMALLGAVSADVALEWLARTSLTVTRGGVLAVRRTRRAAVARDMDMREASCGS
jgi:hypothetical protein